MSENLAVATAILSIFFLASDSIILREYIKDLNFAVLYKTCLQIFPKIENPFRIFGKLYNMMKIQRQKNEPFFRPCTFLFIVSAVQNGTDAAGGMSGCAF